MAFFMPVNMGGQNDGGNNNGGGHQGAAQMGIPTPMGMPPMGMNMLQGFPNNGMFRNNNGNNNNSRRNRRNNDNNNNNNNNNSGGGGGKLGQLVDLISTQMEQQQQQAARAEAARLETEAAEKRRAEIEQIQVNTAALVNAASEKTEKAMAGALQTLATRIATTPRGGGSNSPRSPQTRGSSSQHPPSPSPTSSPSRKRLLDALNALPAAGARPKPKAKAGPTPKGTKHTRLLAFLQEELSEDEVDAILQGNGISGMDATDLPDYKIATVVAELNRSEFGSANDWQKHYKDITGEAMKGGRNDMILRCCYYVHFGRM